jgi:glycosyltransferase involved in cell wall biosynthesis
MSKINVLVFPSDRTGVSKFRSVEPHMKLQELYNDDFHIEIVTAGTDGFNWDDEEYLKKFQIVHFHRTLPKIKDNSIQQVYLEDVYPLFDKLHNLGVITVMDLDDYWTPSKQHPAYDMIINDKLPFKIRDNISRTKYVTTTTPIYANEISKINKNVIVLPNAIDPSEKQFQTNVEDSDRLRFGWLGGSSHYHDLKLMAGNVTRYLRENKDNSQMVICGFDLRGNINERNPMTGEITTRKITPEESIWVRYEEFFTDNYKLASDDLLKHLKRYSQDHDKEFDFSDELYKRVWTKPITTYASNYNMFDVSMAPITENMFNKCKSQLKVIEAGFHKKALIAQDYGPYQIDCVNVFEYGGKINPNGNAVLIESRKNHKEWYKAMKKLKQNPELVDMISENLYNTVKDKYHIDTVTHTRAEFYKTIVKDNQKEIIELLEETNA